MWLVFPLFELWSRWSIGEDVLAPIPRCAGTFTFLAVVQLRKEQNSGFGIPEKLPLPVSVTAKRSSAKNFESRAIQ